MSALALEVSLETVGDKGPTRSVPRKKKGVDGFPSTPDFGLKRLLLDSFPIRSGT